MRLTYTILHQIDPAVTKENAARYVGWLNSFMDKYGINSRLRVCHFLAQVLHESGHLRYSRELASGAAYDTGKLAIRLGNTPQKDGDGQLYKGRGLIQLTGRANYNAFNGWLRQNDTERADVYTNPAIVETPRYAVLSAVYFWITRDLNNLADKDMLTAITKRINGGLNGYDERLRLLTNAKKVIK